MNKGIDDGSGKQTPLVERNPSPGPRGTPRDWLAGNREGVRGKDRGGWDKKGFDNEQIEELDNGGT